MSHRRQLLRAFAMLVVVAGCGDGPPLLYPVSGTVEFSGGEPVRNALIELVPASPAPSPRGRIDAEGAFRIGTYEPGDGAPAGEYRVVVVQPIAPQAMESVGKLGEEHAAHRGSIHVVSLKHATPQATGLSVTVAPVADNDLKIVVEPR